MIGNTLRAETDRAAERAAGATARRKARRRWLISLAGLPIMSTENLQHIDHPHGVAAWNARSAGHDTIGTVGWRTR